jgi:pyruvate,water dikinase
MTAQTVRENTPPWCGSGVVLLEKACPERHGAKAGNLAWVIAAGIPVPRGFVLEEDFLKEHAAGRGEGLTFLELLGGRVIVRSSARGEDSAGASFAGQLESIVCSNAEDEVRRAIDRCRAAHGAARSSSYETKLQARLGGLSILVQEFRDSHVSGVLFSRSPMAPDLLRVEYCAGHSGDLVGGRISPHAAEFSREDLAVRSRSESILLPQAGLEELARLGLRLEGIAGHPVDVEWCYGKESGFEVVQVRPITVAPAPRAGPSLHFSRSNIGENYPEAVCPLLYSVAREAYYHYFRELGGAFGLREYELATAEHHLRNVVGSQAGCLYYNLGSIYACFGAAPAGHAIQEYWNTFLSVRESGSEPVATGSEGRSLRRRLVTLAGLARLVTHGVRSLLGLELKIASFERAVEIFHADALRAGSQPEFAKVLSTFRYVRMRSWLPASLADAAAMFGVGFLKALLGGEAKANPALLASLVEAREGMASAKPVRELSELECLIAASQEWKARFLREEASILVNALSEERDTSEIPRRFFGYLDRWGFRSAGELLLTRPTLLDEPERLVSLLRDRLAADDAVPRSTAGSSAGTTGRKERAAGLPPASRRRLGMVRSLAVTGASGLTRWGVDLRERARLKQAQLYHGLRKATFGLGALLAEEGVLSHANDAFFLTFEELEALAGGSFHLTGTVGSLVGIRKAALEAASKRAAPQSVRLTYAEWLQEASQGPTPEGASTCEGTKPAFLRGLAASPGRVRGRVSVIRSLDEIGSFVPGTILVARYTDPGWTPYFARATGLILEHGGLLCHGAIVAREFGIPTVTEAAGALDTLTTGMEVTLDGGAGWVRMES